MHLLQIMFRSHYIYEKFNQFKDIKAALWGVIILQILWSYTHRSEVVLELVGAASSGTKSSVEAGEVLVVAHLNETRHGLCWEADKVQVPRPAAHCQVP